MPRMSAAALSVVSLDQIEPGKQRPEPPRTLTQAAQTEWRRIVDSMPPDWFPKHTHPMLSQLCRMIGRCNQVAEAIDKAQKAGVDLAERQYQNLIRSEMQLSAAISDLSTKMRLTQQSSVQYDHKRKRTGKDDIPWEGEGEEANNNFDLEEERDAG